MQRLTKLLGIIAIGAVIMAFMGCDNGNGPGPDDEKLGVDLPAITEGTTGRTSITGTNITLEAGQGFSGSLTQAFVNSLDLAGETNQNGVTWSVTDGKLTFSLGTPSQTVTLDAERAGDMGDWTNVQVSPTDAQVYPVEEFEFYTEEVNGNSWERVHYNVAREKFETDNETYYKSSKIIYVYVSKDAAVSGQSGQDEDNVTYTAFNFSLKAGWNLLQMDSYATRNGGTMSISIATKNIPWTVNETGGSSGMEPEPLYDSSGTWDFTVSGQSFTVTITSNNWVFDGPATTYDDTGTFTRNGNAATLYSNFWNTTIGTGQLTSNTTMSLTLISPSLITGTYNGTKLN